MVTLEGRSSHLRFLDGIRGMLALWVMVGHAGTVMGIRVPILGNPGKAVDGFMVLSGFLMAWHFILRRQREPWDRPSTWAAFWTRRFFRIAPLFYVVFAVTMALAVNWEYWNWAEAISRRGSAADSLITLTGERPEFWPNFWQRLTFIFGFQQDGGWSYIPDWSLALEMQFYACFPFLMLWVRRSGIWSVLVISTGIWIVALNLWGVYSIGEGKVLGRYLQPSILPLKLPHFVLGMALAVLWLDQKLTARLTAVLLLVNGAAMWWRKWYGVTTFLVLAGMAAAYPWKADPLRIVSLWEWLLDLLGRPLMRLLGDWSYGIYLVHAPVLLILKPFFVTWPYFAVQPAAVQWLLFVGAVTAVTLPLSYVLHTLIERPGIEAGKRLIALFRSRAPVAVAGATGAN